MKRFFSAFSLANKLSFAIILSVVILIGVLGLYFDTFLQDGYYKTTKKRIHHGFERIHSDISTINDELKKGILFIQSDEILLASIDLVNNYQDKENYNAILLDEEKKSITKQLLDRVKLSLNYEIVLYGKNEEIIAFVTKKEKGYFLCFISYENGKQLLYGKYENENIYKQYTQFELKQIEFKHVSYYQEREVNKKSAITYHYSGNEILIKSHQSIFENNDTIVAHVEMSHKFGNRYFTSIADDLDISISISRDQKYAPNAYSLLSKDALEKISITQTPKGYFGAASLLTQNGNVYLIASLNREILITTLDENRNKLLLILSIVILFMMVVFRFLFTKGLGDPLERLMYQISKIEHGDYSKSKLVSTGDELETISKNVDQLAMAVKEREADLQKSQENLEYMSYHDVLTNLPNRRLFNIQLSHALEIAQRNNTKVAILFLDLDQFKQINDTLGHDVGDELLKVVSKRLHKTVRKIDTLARIGGDEFNILIENIKDVKNIKYIVRKLLNIFKKSFICGEYEISTTMSIGISLYPDDGEDSVTLVKNADLAMYKAKDSGGNNYSFFSHSLSKYIEDRIRWVNALKYALERKDEFFLLYQPKISMQTKKAVGIEALIRWKSSTLGHVMPDQFIPLAEDTNLIIPIGAWVLNKACQDFVSLQKNGYELDQISINVSSVQLQNSNMLKTLKETITQTRINPSQVELEITESYIASNEKKTLNILGQFRNMGIDLAIDDFGTGYSSMSYLQKLPVTRLKIDKSFIDNLPDSDESVAVAKAIIALAKTFNLAITAEGVENESQLNFLYEQECDEIQGYYYAKPLTLMELKQFLDKQ